MMRKIGAVAGAIGAIVCLSVALGVAYAAPPRRGGGAPHPAAHAAAPHFAAPRAAPHFAAPRAAPHFAAPRAAPHFAAPRATPHFAAHRAASRFGPGRTAPTATTHFRAGIAHTRGARMRASNPAAVHGAAAVLHAHGVLARDAGPTDPRNFAARRRFAANPAFRAFTGSTWHRNHHLGWVGPLFWPYAYGDFFYYALWPYDYDDFDPFWAYGYDDIYAGIFSPYDYAPYVQGPQAPARMTSLTQAMKETCDSEAAEVTNWPIDQIQQVIRPNDQQKMLLDDLGNAIVKASNDITSHCPNGVAFTAVDRLGQMEVRLQGMIGAVDIISPPLTTFYSSLDDEQKARFNDMGVAQVTASAATAANGAPNPQPNPQAAQAANPQQACGGTIMAWPSEKIGRVVQPTDSQKQKLQALQSAAAQAADIVKAACPSEMPATPPGRIAAIGKRLAAELKAVQTVEAPLKDFYDSLSDDQKARFNNIGRQIFATR